jgi:hypothetical protein
MPVLRSLRTTTKVAGVVVRLLLATGVASLVLPGVGCSREAPVRPVADAATIPSLTPCADARPDHGLLCGRLSVPEDRSKPGGRRIELNVMVVPASSTPRQPDPIFQFAGGPGVQATSFATSWAGLPFERNRDFVRHCTSQHGDATPDLGVARRAMSNPGPGRSLSATSTMTE